jgi:MoaA/NifB/PqqE/SkfB family radical SAM enzyme
MKIFDPIPSGRTLSLMPTFQCNAACQHCGTLSSPTNKTRIPVGDAEEAIRQAASAGYGIVVFTGGEPTLKGRWLMEAINLATNLKLMTRVVTNGWWGRTDALAEAKVAAFVQAGLNEINFSTGDQHVRFVPLTSVIRALRAAAAADLLAAVMVETVQERTVTKKAFEAHPDFLSLREDFPDARVAVHDAAGPGTNREVSRGSGH